MKEQRRKTKGETMLERGESQFWAYDVNVEDTHKDLVLLDRGRDAL